MPQVETAEQKPRRRSLGRAADIDPSMLGIFLEEFDSVAAQLRQQLPLWLENTSDHRALAELKRGFHTLKGSGRMVGALKSVTFPGASKNCSTNSRESKISFSPSVSDAVKLAVAVLDDLKLRLLGEETELTARRHQDFGRFRQATGQWQCTPDEPAGRGIAGQPDFQRYWLFQVKLAVSESSLETDGDAEARLSAVGDEAEQQAEATAVAPADKLPTQEMDPTLLHLMIGEVQQYLAELEPFVSGLASGAPQEVSKSLVRAVHTLAGTFAMAPLGQESQVARVASKITWKTA